jgi:hypothetical protein
MPAGRIWNVLEHITYADAQLSTNPIEETGVDVTRKLTVLRKASVHRAHALIAECLRELVERDVPLGQHFSDTPSYHAWPPGVVIASPGGILAV